VRNGTQQVERPGRGQDRTHQHGGPVERQDPERSPREVVSKRHLLSPEAIVQKRSGQEERAQHEEEIDAGVSSANEGHRQGHDDARGREGIELEGADVKHEHERHGDAA
jgi:hypothetical protein